MKYVEVTFSDPASHLACDQALLETCENSEEDGFLRVWEPENYFVVVGYSNKVLTEVNVTACEELQIPILRRFTGGGTVLQGPGCLNYSLAVRNESVGIPVDLMESYRFVLGRHRQTFEKCVFEPIEIQGISDLAVRGRKVSGNAQHRKRHCTLFHGSLLLDFDLSLIDACLPMPSKQPAYRHGRSHGMFLRNLGAAPAEVRQALRATWRAEETLDKIPFERIEILARQRYARKDWNFKY
jgi:lipoate-protein ligase A